MHASCVSLAAKLSSRVPPRRTRIASAFIRRRADLLFTQASLRESRHRSCEKLQCRSEKSLTKKRAGIVLARNSLLFLDLFGRLFCSPGRGPLLTTLSLKKKFKIVVLIEIHRKNCSRNRRNSKIVFRPGKILKFRGLQKSLQILPWNKRTRHLFQI